MKKTKGTLYYDLSSERMDILYEDGTREGGLHCGETFEVKIGREWIPTRIEMSWNTDEWYLVGVKNVSNLEGLRVRL